MALFRDKVELNSADKTAIIMRDGVYTYLAGEFADIFPDEDPNKKLRVYRSPESVRKAYEQFKKLGRIPVIFEHPAEDLDLKDYSQGYGYDPELVEEGVNLAIKCKLHLEDESKLAYDEGVREISCGWDGDFSTPDDTSVYDYEQTFSGFNHIALVPEGRCGTLCSIKDQKGATMKTKLKDAKHADLVQKASKYLDEMAEITKTSEEIEDSHAEGLLTAIQGLKEAISGFEAFAMQENKEPMQDEEVVEETEEKEKVEDAGNADLPEAEVEVKEVEDEDKVKEKEEEEVEVKDEEASLNAANEIAMKDAAEFEGGLKEKMTQLKDALSKIGDKCHDEEPAKVVDAKATILDSKTKKYLDARINDAVELGMKLAVKRFHDVLPFIADGTIKMSDVKPGMTPCEIKQKYVEERTGKKYTDAKALAVAFDIATKAEFNDGWKGDGKFHADVLDEKADEIDSIGINKGAK